MNYKALRSFFVLACLLLDCAFPRQLTPTLPVFTTPITQETFIHNEAGYVLFTFHLPANWHTYGNVADGIGLPTVINISTTNEVFYEDPTPHSYSPSPDVTLKSSIYEDGKHILVKLPSPTAVQGHIEWVLCNDSVGCFPMPNEPIEVSDNAWHTSPTLNDDAFQHIATPFHLNTSNSTTPFLLVVLMVFLSGILLNFMPCVIPVLVLKASRLAQKQTPQPLSSQLAFLLGVWLTFMSFALVLVTVKTLGGTVGWGFQFQSPLFVATMTALFLFFTLQTLSLVHIPTFVPSFLYTQTRSQHVQSLFYGVVLTLSSTPCLTPVLSQSIAHALSTSPLQIIILFSSLSIGFALPMMMLERSRLFQKKLPSIRGLSLVVKGLMTALLMGTVFWLLLLFHQLTSTSTLSLFSVFCVLWIFALLLYGKKQTHENHQKRRLYGTLSKTLLAVALVGMVATVKLTPPSLSKPTPAFTLLELQQATQMQDRVLVNITAKWCLTCQVIEKTVLEPPAVKQFLTSQNIEVMTIDWTKPNDDIAKLLASQNQSGIPLYIFYLHGTPNVLNTPWTPHELIEQIDTLTCPSNKKNAVSC